ncbi:MAG: FAD-dependent oxidoreductase [Candidatus Acidiferrales bacterium]
MDIDNPIRLDTNRVRAETLRAHCCIAGGGPAGMVLGFLLARAGVDVVVLEKHADFFRDFRGDTIHPSTLELMYELGLLRDFLSLPHQEYQRISAQIDDFEVSVADFTHLPTHCKFLALMPQWDFLNFVAERAKSYPGFQLRMESEVTNLILEKGRVAGAIAKTPRGELEVRADLTVGADGRHSLVREKAGLEVVDLGAPIDVLWMRISRNPDDPRQSLGRFRAGKILITLDRGEYWQCAFVIHKGAFDEIRARGMQAFRADIENAAPFLRGRTGELKDWDQVKLLAVRVDHLRRWSRDGLLCIGDSAHAMSPVGGVGINLAIQDAVATANALALSLLRGEVNASRLNEVQKRREFPTRVTQAIQVFAHKRFISPALQRSRKLRRLPLPLKLLQIFPLLRRIPARLIGIGARPEHVLIPDTNHPASSA